MNTLLIILAVIASPFILAFAFGALQGILRYWPFYALMGFGYFIASQLG